MAERNKIEVKLMRGNEISKTTAPDVKLIDKMIKEGQKEHKIVDPVLVINSNDHAEIIKYGESTIRLSPRARQKVADASLLGELPKGVLKKKLQLSVSDVEKVKEAKKPASTK